MRPEEKEKVWAEFLAGRKARIPAADPAFTHRVMESVRAAEAAFSVAKGPARAGRERPSLAGGLAARARAWIALALRPRYAVAMASLMLAAGSASLYLAMRPDSAGAGTGLTRIKGHEFQLGFLLKRGDRIEPAVSGAVYQSGDRLQAVYSSSSRGYIHLYSLDESGSMVCFSCPGGNAASPAGQGKTLGFALELDGSPRAEAMVGLWTPRPAPRADLEAILRAAWEKAGRDLTGLRPRLDEALPAGGKASVFHLQKRGKT